MRCELEFGFTQRDKAFSRYLSSGSHLLRGQREYSRGGPRREAGWVNPRPAFSFDPAQTLLVRLHVLFVFPPVPEHTPAQEAIVKSLRGVPAYYRMTNSDEVEVKQNRHSLGDWERPLLTDTKALGKSTSAPTQGRGVAVSKDRQRRKQGHLFKMLCTKCKVKEAYWSASWCADCLWDFVKGDQ